MPHPAEPAFGTSSAPTSISSGTIRYSVPEAAKLLGITERAVRKRIEAGTLLGKRNGREWVVLLPKEPVREPKGASSGTDSEPDGTAAEPRGTSGTGSVEAIVEKLYRDNLELAGRVGFYQAEIQHLKTQLEAAQTRILELEAPKQAPAEMPNHPTPEQNGQDSAAQTVSVIPEEQPEAGRRSEVSAPSVTNGQEGSSGGAFKRFWRWLARPV